MPVVQCPNPTNCEGVENPVSNLSAEGPDIAKCFRYSFGPQSQAVCEFNLSLCSAFAAVGADVGIFCDPPDAPPGGPNPPPPVIYSSSAQSCTVICADSTTETYTVVAGSFVALSQAEADADAFAFACQLAAMQCTGPVTTFTNTPQTCSFTCPNGVAASYTTPADFFTALSQAEANLNAFLFACDVAALLCGGPPVGTFPGGGTQPQQPVDPVYANSAQSCGSTCPDGSVFTYVINAGTYTAESRAAANAIARSAACSLANSFRVCLSNLPSGFCVNEFVFEAMDATGLASPVSFSVVSGALPDGLVLTSQGFLQGVPTSPGSFTAVIRATGADGNSVARSYTMAVGEITPDFLPDANTSDPYAEALTANGFSGPIEWSIIAGSLPVPLELNPSTGVISGDAPEDDGDFFFTVQATDGVLTCSKDYELHVEGAQVQLYWKLDQAVAAANTDSVTGQALFINNFGAVVTGVPAKISNGLQITGGFCNVSETNQAALYQGTGWTFAFWIRWSSLGTGNEGVQWSWCSGPIQNFTWIIGTGEYHFPYDGVSELTGNTPILAADVFHFVAFRYDPATGKLSYSFNGAAFVDLPGNAGVMAVNPDPAPYILGGNEEVILDELGAYSFVWDAADLAYMWNAGAGRTFPFSFPP